MLTERQSNRVAAAERVATLSGIEVRRPAGADAAKHGDITAALAAMPASSVVLETEKIFAPNPGGMRDVTPAAVASPDEILDYWHRLRGTDAMPSRNRLKASEVAARWPGSVLFRCAGGAAGMHPDSAFSTALRANSGGRASNLPREPETTALLSQWMLRVAGTVAADGAPVHQCLTIDTSGGRIEFAIDSLPFTDEGDRPGYVLCHVAPVR